MMETLAIIAHRQPCTRADVEAIRGVQSAELIKQLMERKLIRVLGEDNSLGRPFLYGTTRLFLESYGLTNLSQLPFAEQLGKPKPADENAGEAETEPDDEPAAA
jgi:segregation and condensation protein B